MTQKISRRDFLKVTGASAAGLALASCSAKPTELPTPTKMNKVHRIVTGFNNAGKSIILMDADMTNLVELMPGFRAKDIWATETAPADNTGIKDMGEREFAVAPPKSGTVFRYFEIDSGIGIDEPGWHATDTVDYIVIVKGEIYCMMDEGEVLLKVGDLMVQRGTNHAWVNRSDEMCVLVGVMVSATPLS